MASELDTTVHRSLIETMMKEADEAPESAPVGTPGVERCFYTLWGREDEITWEAQLSSDLSSSIVPGTGRQDWRKLRPFDFLPEVDREKGGVARMELYAGEHVRVSVAHISGGERHFERAGDFDTILVQFAGVSVVETNFGVFEVRPGEALLVPAMVAHRTTGSPSCRRVEYTVRELVSVHLPAAEGEQQLRFRIYPEGDPSDADGLAPSLSRAANGKIPEHLTRWEDLPGDDFWFERTHDWMVGKADRGRAPIKIRPFEHFKSTSAVANDLPPVRSALLWDSATFRQRVYSNPGRQPAPHRGYDEDELWLQFVGPVRVETEHAIYEMQNGSFSMAEAGVSHTSVSTADMYRLTSYSPKPIRMVVDPANQLRETKWIVEVSESDASGAKQ
ncbi:hypothetical protein [Paraburkholderia caffeinilytica]|uniref:hypothetical protein n=1 Tax=Paraburkholderia caffeinilytica TaxID=1761016 RepID=UPI0038B92BEA